MENIFTNKKIWKKLVAVFLIIMAFQIFVNVPIVKAAPDESSGDNVDNSIFGGVLMRPIVSLTLTIADGAVNLLHDIVMGQDTTLVPVSKETDWIAIIGGVLTGLVVAAAVIVFSAVALGVIGTVLAGMTSLISVGGIGMGTLVVAGATGYVCGSSMYTALMPDQLRLPLYSYSAEEIFSGNILLFNVDFFNEDKEIYVCYKEKIPETGVSTGSTAGTQQNVTTSYTLGEEQTATKSSFDTMADKDKYDVQYYYFVDSDGNRVRTSPQDSARELKETISSWYVAIRYICIVIMLSVLIYIGIRMTLSSVANDKAKYKDMLKDWLIGLCLLFLIHYIMAFSNLVVEKFTEVIKTAVDENSFVVLIPDKYDGKLVETANELGFNSEFVTKQVDENGKEIDVLMYPTNLMGKIRLELQLKDNGESGKYIGLTICYLILVIFTVMFTFTYLRRLLYMAFLTIISPLVAMTYCIDKVNDGQAQGFNTWLKEYIFNLLIQPMHLLLYYVLVSAAFKLSSTNVIYSIVALGFMLPAEKLLRSLFGFEKAKTPPLLGGPVGTALAMQGINMIRGLAGRGGAASTSRSAVSSANVNSESNSNERISRSTKTFEALAAGTSSDDDTPARTREEHSPSEEIPELGGDISDDGGRTVLASNAVPLNTGGISGPEQPDTSPIRTREQIQDDLDAVTALENDIVDDDSLDYAISERERLENELAGLDASSSQIPNDEPDSVPTITGAQGRVSNSNSSSSTSSESRPQKYRALGRPLARIYDSGKAAAKSAIRNVPRAVGGAARVGAGIVTGGTLGAIGLASAVASGDERNVATMTGAGLGTGLAIAGGARPNAKINEDTRRAIDEVYHGEEYEQEDREKAYKEATKDDYNKLRAERALGSKAAAEKFMGKDGNMRKWMREGQTDFEDMLAQERLVNDPNVNVSADEAAATMDMLKRFGGKAPDKMDKKTRTNLHGTLISGLRRADARIDETRADERAKDIERNMDLLARYRK